jgi:hypothetical protein
MANITDLERQIHELDEADEAGGEGWKLKNRNHDDGTMRNDLLKELEKEVNEYGIALFIFSIILF